MLRSTDQERIAIEDSLLQFLTGGGMPWQAGTQGSTRIPQKAGGGGRGREQHGRESLLLILLEEIVKAG